jgi:hypothetical protein
MWRWTHHGAKTLATSDTPITPLLDEPSLRLPSQRDMVLPAIDPGDSDGIVSTHRQVLGELIGVVVGDHVDVLGRYRRTSLVDEKTIDPGLLTSGAEFGDDEFFALLALVADRIAKVI